MPTQSSLISGEVIAGASVDVLLATAQTFLREATDRARTGTTDVPRDELIDQAVTCQQVQNAAWAAQSVRLAQVAAIEEVLSSAGEEPREVRHAIGTYADEWLPQEVGARLGWSDRQTANRLGDAVDAIRCQTLGTKLTRALVDSDTGVTVETSDITYRPGARLRRFVVTRDLHCRFPGVHSASATRRRRPRHPLA